MARSLKAIFTLRSRAQGTGAGGVGGADSTHSPALISTMRRCGTKRTAPWAISPPAAGFHHILNGTRNSPLTPEQVPVATMCPVGLNTFTHFVGRWLRGRVTPRGNHM